MVMCSSFVLMLSSQMSMIFLKARRLSSSVFGGLANVVIAIFSSAQRQLREKPTSPLLAVVGGILALVMLLDGSLVNTWM